MSTTLQIFQIIFYSVAIIFMITFMIIGVWAFVLFIKTCKGKTTKNYLLDKLNKNVANLNNSYTNNNYEHANNPTDFLSESNLDEN